MCSLQGEPSAFGVFPVEIWENIVTSLLVSDLKSLSVLASSSHSLAAVTTNVFRHSHIDLELHSSEKCCAQAGSSNSNGKRDYRLVMRMHKRRSSISTSCRFPAASLSQALGPLLAVCSPHICSLRLNGIPSDALFYLSTFDLQNVFRVELDRDVPKGNAIFELLQTCDATKMLSMDNLSENFDFIPFFRQLKGSKLEGLRLRNLTSMHLSSPNQFFLPPSLRRLSISSENCKDGSNVVRLLHAGQWEVVEIHSLSPRDPLLGDLYRNLSKSEPLKSIRRVIVQTDGFPMETLSQFVKKCENLEELSWRGLHECGAAIVVSRIITDMAAFPQARSLSLTGTAKCVGGCTMATQGVLEVTERVPGIRVSVETMKAKILDPNVEDHIVFGLQGAKIFYTRRSSASESRVSHALGVKVSA